MPGIISAGKLFLAQPPLYRISSKDLTLYATDDNHKDELIKNNFKSNQKIDISRFKGLGEMPSKQLKDTTMDINNRTLLKIDLLQDSIPKTFNFVDSVMGKNSEKRLQFIQDKVKANEVDFVE